MATPMPNFNPASIQNLMEQENISSHAELARRLGVSRACINRLANGQRGGRGYTLLLIMQHFPHIPQSFYFLPSPSSDTEATHV